MLLRFRFSNFRSFREEQELSLIASTLSTSQDGVFHPSGIQERVLPVIAMYGANASGKTNVLRALEFMATTIRETHARWEPDAQIPRQPFGTQEGGSAPSTFVADFLLDNVRYQYGFSVNSEEVLEEWLSAYPRGKKQTWFTRKQGAPVSFSSKMPGDNRTIEGLTRRNSLFLAAAAQNNHAVLSPIHHWFSGSIWFTIGSRPVLLQTEPVLGAPAYKNALARLLSFADLGIADLLVQEVEVPNEATEFVAGVRSHLEDLENIFLKALKASARSEQVFQQALGLLENATKQVQFLHRFGNSEIPFRQDQESNGTLAYLALLGRILLALKQETVVCIDELDASLHPLLAIQLIRLFTAPTPNKQSAQLIFTSHDTNLLSPDILRRDEPVTESFSSTRFRFSTLPDLAVVPSFPRAALKLSSHFAMQVASTAKLIDHSNNNREYRLEPASPDANDLAGMGQILMDPEREALGQKLEVQGVTDVFGRTFTVKPAKPAPPAAAPKSKDAATWYLNFLYQAGFGITPAWIADGKVAPMLGLLPGGFFLTPSLNVDTGQGQVGQNKTNDLINPKIAVTRLVRAPAGIFEAVQFTPAFSFETDRKRDKQNALFAGDIRVYLRGLENTEAERSQDAFLRARLRNPRVLPQDVPKAKFGYRVELLVGAELGSSLTDNAVQSSDQSSQVVVPK